MKKSQYTIRLADNFDQQSWDAYVVEHSEASPYHLFAWKIAIEEAYGHKGYYLLAEENNRIVGLLPLIHFRLPFLLNEFNSLPFCDVGNVLCNHEDVFKLLLKESLTLCSKKNIKRMYLRGEFSCSEEQIDELSTEYHNKVRMLLRLPASSDALMTSFKSKLRSQIRKAEKNGLTFLWGNDEDIDAFYAVFSENMRDLGSPVHSKNWFRSILKHYSAHAKMGLVGYKDEIVGGCILLSVGGTIAIPWASTLRKYNRLAPNMLLYWNVLQYSADAGFSIFDLGRSSEGEGTYKFKKQWGAKPHPLSWYNYQKPLHHNEDEKRPSRNGSKQKIAKIWSKLPLSVANIIGPKIRRYINL